VAKIVVLNGYIHLKLLSEPYTIITKLLRRRIIPNYSSVVRCSFLYLCEKAVDRMEKRIKILYRITIIALLSLIVTQGYWLVNQYVYTLQKYEDELYQETLKVATIDKANREKLYNKNLIISTNTQVKIKQSGTTAASSIFEWNLNAFLINRKEIDPNNTALMHGYVDSLNQSSRGVKKFSFFIREANNQNDVYYALNLFYINERCRFTTARFNSILKKNGLNPTSIKIETTSSTIWNPQRINHTSLWHPTLQVTYPFNILQKQQVLVTYNIDIQSVMSRMLEFLIASFILTLLLIFCLIYQIKTIYKQQRIEELRKDFVHTMIHELKRPIATLKMSVSFMKSDKMMQDKEMKDDILSTSQKELDNLSSYFSKLRDLTYGDLEEIPLNLYTFNLKELVNECIEKQHLPTDRLIRITTDFELDNVLITADKMHIANIINNLLENAIKYSQGETSIHIFCRREGEDYILEISDTGIGISEEECDLVFDRFFRSKSVADKDIPGIGLGLSYVKLLVSAHKGTITLKSKLGVGTTFTIKIPHKQ
jgi:two-component system, OmpR family, phosphate regulon sensor histidine kinase PhoR